MTRLRRRATKRDHEGRQYDSKDAPALTEHADHSLHIDWKEDCPGKRQAVYGQRSLQQIGWREFDAHIIALMDFDPVTNERIEPPAFRTATEQSGTTAFPFPASSADDGRIHFHHCV